MKFLDPTLKLRYRQAPLNMHGAEFRQLGHELVDRIAELFDELPQRPVTAGESPQTIRQLLGAAPLPEQGAPAGDLLSEATDLLFDHSLFNGHPKFWGYITAAAAPIGVLAEFLAAAVNPNVGAFTLSPMATEIEAQTVRWIADLIGYPRNCGGLLVSGGNMANFVCFLAARKAKAPWDVQSEGLPVDAPRLVAYVSKETHTWIDKAADLFGLGANAVRWIGVNSNQQMDIVALEEQIIADRAAGLLPFLVVGTAGTVGTGAVDPLPEIAAICRQYDLWFHVDGAYGAPAAALPDASPDLLGLRDADSIALDPHKWLYSPLEAGCALVRNPHHLVETFSHHPTYYNFDGIQEDPPINYYAFGMQNSRGFRALKVWLALRQVGRAGYIQMIGDDIALAQALYQAVGQYPELQAVTQSLSITTFRFVPPDLPTEPTVVEPYLNKLNEALLNRLQKSGEAFVSNALVEGKYLLRACIVNFRTTLADIEALPKLVIDLGRTLDAEMRPHSLHPEWRYRMSISPLPVESRPVQPLVDLLRFPSPLSAVIRLEQ
ncbi:MAG: aspartate aminotransferase family protein [Caldilinea sp. CFX5]|nr:aspartate aminotransferase family protein [Caldilinea sp. CFX5]